MHQVAKDIIMQLYQFLFRILLNSFFSFWLAALKEVFQRSLQRQQEF